MPKIITPLGQLPEELTKAELEDLGTYHAEQILDGSFDVRRVYLELRRYQVYLDAAATRLRDDIVESAEEGTYDLGKTQLACRSYRQFKYAEDDIILGRINADLAELKATETEIKSQAKAHQAILLAINDEYLDVVDEATGELIRLYPPEVTHVRRVSVRV